MGILKKTTIILLTISVCLFISCGGDANESPAVQIATKAFQIGSGQDSSDTLQGAIDIIKTKSQKDVSEPYTIRMTKNVSSDPGAIISGIPTGIRIDFQVFTYTLANDSIGIVVANSDHTVEIANGTIKVAEGATLKEGTTAIISASTSITISGTSLNASNTDADAVKTTGGSLSIKGAANITTRDDKRTIVAMEEARVVVDSSQVILTGGLQIQGKAEVNLGDALVNLTQNIEKGDECILEVKSEKIIPKNDNVDSEKIVEAIHNHSFSLDWQSSDTHHWHEATCNHVDLKSSYLEHSWTDWEITLEPTHSTHGERTRTCLVCGRVNSEPTDPDPNIDDHTWGEGFVVVEPGCLSEGLIRYYCLCGQTKDEPIPATGHSYSTEWESDADYHWHMSICEHIDEISDCSNHNWPNSWTVRTEATENDEGEQYKRCTVCGYEKTSSIPILLHVHTFNYDEWVSDSDYHWHPATCGHIDEKVDCSNHSWPQLWTVRIEATENNEGEQYKRCTVCGHEITSVIPMIPHVHTFNLNQWEYDSQRHWHPATCEHVDEKRDIANHSWPASWTVRTEATEESEGEKYKRCLVCGYEKTSVIATIPHFHTFDLNVWEYDSDKHWHPATCIHNEEKGNYTNHAWSEWETITPSTENSNGEKRRVCLVCGAEEYGIISANTHNHQWSSVISSEENSIIGYELFRCNDCHLYKLVRHSSSKEQDIINPNACDGNTVFGPSQKEIINGINSGNEWIHERIIAASVGNAILKESERNANNLLLIIDNINADCIIRGWANIDNSPLELLVTTETTETNNAWRYTHLIEVQYAGQVKQATVITSVNKTTKKGTLISQNLNSNLGSYLATIVTDLLNYQLEVEDVNNIITEAKQSESNFGSFNYITTKSVEENSTFIKASAQFENSIVNYRCWTPGVFIDTRQNFIVYNYLHNFYVLEISIDGVNYDIASYESFGNSTPHFVFSVDTSGITPVYWVNNNDSYIDVRIIDETDPNCHLDTMGFRYDKESMIIDISSEEFIPNHEYSVTLRIWDKTPVQPVTSAVESYYIKCSGAIPTPGKGTSIGVFSFVKALPLDLTLEGVIEGHSYHVVFSGQLFNGNLSSTYTDGLCSYAGLPDDTYKVYVYDDTINQLVWFGEIDLTATSSRLINIII